MIAQVNFSKARRVDRSLNHWLTFGLSGFFQKRAFACLAWERQSYIIYFLVLWIFNSSGNRHGCKSVNTLVFVIVYQVQSKILNHSHRERDNVLYPHYILHSSLGHWVGRRSNIGTHNQLVLYNFHIVLIVWTWARLLPSVDSSHILTNVSYTRDIWPRPSENFIIIFSRVESDGIWSELFKGPGYTIDLYLQVLKELFLKWSQSKSQKHFI